MCISSAYQQHIIIVLCSRLSDAQSKKGVKLDFLLCCFFPLLSSLMVEGTPLKSCFTATFSTPLLVQFEFIVQPHLELTSSLVKEMQDYFIKYERNMRSTSTNR